jgi:hypothetical protein
MNRTSRCCIALEQNVKAAPKTMQAEYGAAISICHKLLGNSAPEEEKLVQIRAPLVTVLVPASCQ